MARSKVTASFDTVDLKHPHFAYLDTMIVDKMVLQKDLADTHHIFVAINVNDNHEYTGILQIFNDRVHVREVGGNFVFTIRYLEQICHVLCRFYGIKKITLCARSKTVGKIAEKRGFIKYNNEFMKEVA